MKMPKWMALTVALLCSQAHAGTVKCSGTVEDVSFHASDKLMIRLSSMNAPVFFCSPAAEWVVSGTHYRTSVETCKALYSTFLTARVSGLEIRNLYFDGDDVPTTCDSWGPWKSASIRHFKL